MIKSIKSIRRQGKTDAQNSHADKSKDDAQRMIMIQSQAFREQLEGDGGHDSSYVHRDFHVS